MNQDLTQELAQAQAELVASKEATARAEAKIAAVQAELAKPKPWKRWKPKKGEWYWFDCCGRATQTRWVDSDIDLYDAGNVHRTKEAAERYALRIRSMVPTCPVPKEGDMVWWASPSGACHETRWTGSLADLITYNQGRVFTTGQAAKAWVAEFGDAWTTLEDAS